MRRFLLIIILIYPVILLSYWIYRGLYLHENMPSAPESIATRLQEYGPDANSRMHPYFDAAQVAYPPARAILLGLKQEKRLEVYAANANEPLHFIRSYPILAASGLAGPKLREGDQQVPEGIYPVESLNPNSKYHLALRVGYPDDFDREQAKRDGRDDLGGDIMIHGGAVSVGCLAVGDEAAEDLFVLAADAGITNVTVVISPVDFRKPGTATVASMAANLPVWTAQLYQAIRNELNELPANN
jgi:murein L,D-transpeptidase YafK